MLVVWECIRCVFVQHCACARRLCVLGASVCLCVRVFARVHAHARPCGYVRA